jgi:hypothetical protein
MPVPLGRSGSEPQDPSAKRDLHRHHSHPSNGQSLVLPMGGRDVDNGRESALGLENMHPDQRQAMKPPTVGRQSWYAV